MSDDSDATREGLPVWADGTQLCVGDRVAWRGYDMGDAERARACAARIRVYLTGDSFQSRGPDLTQQYAPELLGPAVDAAYARGMTLGEWIADLVRRELGAARRDRP